MHILAYFNAYFSAFKAYFLHIFKNNFRERIFLRNKAFLYLIVADLL